MCYDREYFIGNSLKHCYLFRLIVRPFLKEGGIIVNSLKVTKIILRKVNNKVMNFAERLRVFGERFENASKRFQKKVEE